MYRKKKKIPKWQSHTASCLCTGSRRSPRLEQQGQQEPPPLEQQGQQEPPAGAAGAAVPLCGMDFYFRVKNVEEF